MQIQVCDNINCQGATGKLFSQKTVLKPLVDLAPEPLTLDQADLKFHENSHFVISSIVKA